MAHYAFLDENNIVVDIITGKDETELIEGLDPETWYGNFRGQTCIRTSISHNIRRRYAWIGDTYDSVNDVFIRPKPYPSWTLNENFDWVPPVPHPHSLDTSVTILRKQYYWSEETTSWIEDPNWVVPKNFLTIHDI